MTGVLVKLPRVIWCLGEDLHPYWSSLTDAVLNVTLPWLNVVERRGLDTPIYALHGRRVQLSLPLVDWRAA